MPVRPFVPLLLALLLALLFPAAVRGQATGTIRGQAVEERTGAPLPGVHVVVVGTRPLLGAVADAEGWFVVEGVPVGRRDVAASFLGYAPRVLAGVLVTSGRDAVLRVALAEAVLEGGEVVVTPGARRGRALNGHAPVSARAFSVEETRRYAGGLDDPARMASAFAGIATNGGVGDNAVIIRGNAPKGVGWRLEGVEIPTPSHFAGLTVAGGGGLTLFSGSLLADSDVLTGAFPAEYGDALAGVFDLRFRTGNPARRTHAVGIGLLGVEAAAEGPFVAGGAATYLANYRYATLGLLLPLLPTEDVATYQDLSFKLSLPTRAYGRFEAWGVGGLDRQAMAASRDSAAWDFETWDRLDGDLRLGVGAAGIGHDLVLGRRTLLHTALAATGRRTRLDQRRMSDDLVLRDNLAVHHTDARLILSAHLDHGLHARHTSRTGLTVQRIRYNLDLTAAPRPNALPEPVARERGLSTLLGVFTQSRFDLAERLSVDVGARLQHLALTGATSLEPRVGLRWHVRPGETLTLGYGLHSAAEDLRLYLVRPPTPADAAPADAAPADAAPADAAPADAAPVALPNRRLGFTRAHHLVVGYDRALGEAARVGVEIYLQRLFDVPIVPGGTFSLLNFEQDFTFAEGLVGTGAGANAGVELTLERSLEDGYYYLLTGSVFRARYRGGDGAWRPTRFDRRYTGNALFGREVVVDGDDLLGLNGRLTLLGGERRTPVDEAASRAAEAVVYDETGAFSERGPGFLLVDLTVTYRRNHARRSAVWALQIKNALGAQDIVRDYSFATRRVEEVREGFPLPVLSYTLEF